MRRIVVHEYDTLSLATDLSTAELNALSAFNDRHGARYFQLLHQGIAFKNYVGALQVGNLQIEILPKLDRTVADAPLRGVLVKLLQICKGINIEVFDQASLRLGQGTLLALYYQAFLQAVEQLMRQGLLRSYRKNIQQRSNWKGQIQFAQQMRLAWRQMPTIVSKAYEHSYVSTWHQLLYIALRQLLQMPIHPKWQQWAERLLLDFPPQPPIAVSTDTFKKLVYDQKHLPYQKAIQLASLLLLGYQPKLETGGHTVFGMLFDMNRLYEDYIYQLLSEALAPHEQLERQGSRPFWANKTLRPDFLLKIGRMKIVLDAKWKLLDRPMPEDQDLRQIYVYQRHFGAQEGWLLYPSVGPRASLAHPFLDETKDFATMARLVWLDLLDEQGQLNQDLGQQLLNLARTSVAAHSNKG